MTLKDHHVAKDIARALRQLSHVDAVLLLHEGKPIAMARIDPKPTDPTVLAKALLELEDTSPAALGRALGASDTWEVTPGRLGKVAYNLKATRRGKKLERLLKDGHKPLRPWTLDTIASLHTRVTRAATQMSTCLETLSRASATPGSALWTLQTLPVRASALGAPWPHRRIAEAWGPALRAALTPHLDPHAPDPVRRLAMAVAIHHGNRADWKALLPAALHARAAQLSTLPVEALVLLMDHMDDALIDALRTCPWPRHVHRAAIVSRRAAMLYGTPAGIALLELMVRPWTPPPKLRVSARVRRFLHIARRPHTDLDTPEEETLAAHLSKLNPNRRARKLVELFLRWLRGDEHRHNVTKDALNRAVASTEEKTLGALTEAMVRCWLDTARAAQATIRPTDGWRRQALTIGLAHPGLHYAQPAPRSTRKLAVTRSCIEATPRALAQEAWQWLAQHRHNPSKVWTTNLDDMGVKPLLAMRALFAGLDAWELREFAPLPERRLRRYLDVLEHLNTEDKTLINIQSGWFRNLFTASNVDLDSSLVLTLLGRSRSSQGWFRDIERLHALSKALEHPAALLAQALEDWQNTRVENRPTPEYDTLRDFLGADENALDTYLHYRRIAGHGESFSEAVLEPLEQEKSATRQLEWLSDKLQDPALDETLKKRFETRLRTLTNPTRSQQRLDAIKKRGLNKLDRATQQLSRESLEHRLSKAMHTALERLLGRSIDVEAMPSGFDALVLLLPADSLDMALWTTLVEAVLSNETRLEDLPPNTAWRTRAQKNWDVVRWSRGLQTTLEHNGQQLALETEQNLIEALRMGSYFSTCLSLDDGDNAASTVVNALDINKQVLYLRTASGTVVGRKLIGATAQGQLVGYRTYLQPSHKSIAKHLNRAIVDFAMTCGLTPSNTHTPETIHNGFWYNDGNETWALEDDLPQDALAFPNDAQARFEWALCQAAQSEPKEALELWGRLHFQHEETLADAAQWHANNVLDTPLPDTLCRNVILLLTMGGQTDWWDTTDINGYDKLGLAMYGLRADEASQNASLALFQQHRQTQPHKQHENADAFSNPPATTVHLAPNALINLAQTVQTIALRDKVDCIIESHQDCTEDWIGRWSNIFFANAGLHQEESPTGLFDRIDGFMTGAIAAHMAERGLAPAAALRKALRTHRGHAHRSCALGLGLVGRPDRDKWKLKNLQKEHPDALEYALALARIEPETAPETAQLWRIPDPLPLKDELWSSRVAELSPNHIAKELARTIAEQHDPNAPGVPAQSLLHRALQLFVSLEADASAQFWPSLMEYHPTLAPWSTLDALTSKRRQWWRALRRAPRDDIHQTIAYWQWRTQAHAQAKESLSADIWTQEPGWVIQRFWDALPHANGDGLTVIVDALLNLIHKGSTFAKCLIIIIPGSRLRTLPLELQSRLGQFAIRDATYCRVGQPQVTQVIFNALIDTDPESTEMVKAVQTWTSMGWMVWMGLWAFEGRPDFSEPSLSKTLWMRCFDPSLNREIESWLEEALVWLPPSHAERWIPDMLADFDDTNLSEAITNNHSHRLTTWAIEILKTRLGDTPHDIDFDDFLQNNHDDNSPRKTLIIEQLKHAGLWQAPD